MSIRNILVLPLVAGIAAASSIPVHASDDAALSALVDQRLAGDRTGACMGVAVVDKGSVSRTFRCALPDQAGRVGPDSAFEIGSVSKTMTSTVLAKLILEGKGSLDDPLSDWLPGDTDVPAFEGQQILLRHLVTHTSGLPALPSRMAPADPADPYADLTPRDLLASLGDATLSRAPGSRFEYSNFASMVLSYAVARRAGLDMETLLRQALFDPLGMEGAYVARRPDGVRAATGHAANGLPTPAWTFATDLAGVGGVRATLDDMVRYVQANLEPEETPLQEAIELAHAPVGAQPPMAMNWMLLPVEGRTVLVHEGATGGFSSFVSVDREARRGVVILSDTSWSAVGNLGSLGLHLVDDSFPLGGPRTVEAPPQALLDGLEGDYQLQGAMKVSLRQRDGTLFARPAGQPEFELAYDSAGDFFPLQLDALLKPQRTSDGSFAFTWMQGGAAVPAIRLAEGGTATERVAPTADALAGYAGDYTLMPGFVLTLRAREGGLSAQATGQGEFALEAAGPDRFEARAHGIEIVFKRGADGAVESLELHQGGNVLTGARE
ncbi:MAG: serine hydrolase [Gammaproteobacteria bacterium]|nr:serine hydrolase [Gammaproteobacteria bacterium]